MNPANDKAQAESAQAEGSEWNLICGAGGSRAILASAGAILACHHAGIEKWRKIGGASGGSIPTALLAAGMHPVDLAHLAVETDFSQKITRHASLWQVIFTYLLKDNFYLLVRPRKGLFGSRLLGEFINKKCPTWPEKFWTVAASGSSQIVFSADGVWEYMLNGRRRCISKEPPTVGLAVRATAAIPGVFDAVKYRGHYLFDGALSIDGRTPVGPLTRHMGVTKLDRVIAVDVMEGTIERPLIMFFIWKVFWRIVCGRHCPIEGQTPVNSEGTVLIKPEITEFDALQFKLHPDQKWHGLVAGYTAGVAALEKAGILTGVRLDEARAIVRAYDEIKSTSTQPGERAARLEALLAAHGLY